ncbi:glycosyl hydrolase family 8 [Frondihabitans australicus]|uniref:Glucanase n=1 Tax=Frondihabitans australicus TaxID=386892 RepID=A0A495IBT2_9MICO|nr:glycosyl hydrolase family 8 [Frondihabitans australicus]RKR73382.1 endoglucanase [Frondihabitans australicus]
MTGGIAAVAVGLPGSDSSAPAPSASATSTPTSNDRATSTRSAKQIGQAFLADYLDSSGRIVRRDQGGDTVSEGQGYGMLVAVGVGDRSAFRSIWTWTKSNLERKDGLMAWQWKNGKVVDEQPASDADLDIARALVLAGTTFHDASYTKAGKALAGHIADDLTVGTPDGRVLLPGLWAKQAGGTAGPWSYDPSYAAPATFSLLAKATGDDRWSQLVTGSRKVTGRILQSTALPADWEQIRADGSVVPLPNATGSGGTVMYGYDAGRVALRYAASCSADDTALAAKLAAPLAGKSPLPMELDLGGTPLNQDQSPLGYDARAAARASAGDASGARSDLRAADRLAQRTPTYYGSAWDALAALQLETTTLGGCSPLAGE